MILNKTVNLSKRIGSMEIGETIRVLTVKSKGGFDPAHVRRVKSANSKDGKFYSCTTDLDTLIITRHK